MKRIGRDITHFDDAFTCYIDDVKEKLLHHRYEVNSFKLMTSSDIMGWKVKPAEKESEVPAERVRSTSRHGVRNTSKKRSEEKKKGR